MPKLGSHIMKRSIVVVERDGRQRKTSISLEDEFWHHVRAIAEAQQLTISAFVSTISQSRPRNLSSAIRLRVLKQYAPTL